MLGSFTDQQLAEYITNIPAHWEWTNLRGNKITKRQLDQSKWGSHKNDDDILSFQTAILLSYPPPGMHTVFGSLHTTNVVTGGGAWRTHIVNQLDGSLLTHPLENPITIFQIYHSHHFTTLITDANTYHHYDSLKGSPPLSAKKLVKYINQWYIQHPQPLPHRRPGISIQSKKTPPQCDAWTCSMHMLLITLTAL